MPVTISTHWDHGLVFATASGINATCTISTTNYGPAHKAQNKIQPPNETININQQPTPKKKARKNNKLKEYETILADDIRIATNKRELDQTFASSNADDLVDLGTPSAINKKRKLGPILNERFSRNL